MNDTDAAIHTASSRATAAERRLAAREADPMSLDTPRGRTSRCCCWR